MTRTKRIIQSRIYLLTIINIRIQKDRQVNSKLMYQIFPVVQIRALPLMIIMVKQRFVSVKAKAGANGEFNVTENGNYELYFDYLALPGNGKNIGISVLIDGTVPFSDFESISLPRLWKDSESDFTENGEFKKDETGNQIRPKKIEVQQWQETALYDTQGLYSEPYFVYLEKGTHKLRVNAIQESMAIASITLKNGKSPKSVELYSSYGLDREFCFYSRFRTGEMVLSIQPYNTYNQLASAAPEIRGLWKMAPVPITVQSSERLIVPRIARL